MPPALDNEVRRQTNQWLKEEIIRPSISHYNSPAILVKKKPDADGKVQFRLCIDLRELNSRTLPDNFPMPNVTTLIEEVADSKYFCTLDLSSGFLQVELDESSKH